MASKRSAQFPNQWPDGSWHSISWQQETRNREQAHVQQIAQQGAANGNPGLQANLAAKPGQSVVGGAATPEPPDPYLENQKLTAGRNIALGNSEAAYQTGNLGFDAGYNPDGTVNTANPYSRAALLQLGYENQQRGTTNSMAAAGQLYSGAIENQRGIDSRGYSQAEAANRLGYQRALHGVQAGQLSNMANNSLGVGTGDFEALLRATYPAGT